MAKARGKKTAAKRGTKSKSSPRGSKALVDVEAVRQRITHLVAKAAPAMTTAVIEEVTNRGNVTGLKYLFEAAGMFPRPEEPEVEEAEETMTDRLIRQLEVGMIPATAEEEESDPETTGIHAVE